MLVACGTLFWFLVSTGSCFHFSDAVGFGVIWVLVYFVDCNIETDGEGISLITKTHKLRLKIMEPWLTHRYSMCTTKIGGP